MSASAEWDRLPSRRRLWPSAIVFLGFSGLWLWNGATAVIEGRWLYALFYFPAAIAFVLVWFIAQQVYRHRDSTYTADTDSVAVDDAGVVFRQTLAMRVSTATTILGTVVAGTAFAVGMWTHRLEFPMTGSQNHLFPVVGAVLAVGYAVTGIWFLVGWAHYPEVRCTSATVTVRRFLSSQSVAWSDVVTVDSVLDRQSAGIRLTTGEPVAVIRPGPGFFRTAKAPVVFAADQLGVGTIRLKDFLTYYVAHPESRHELNDQRALDRALS